MNQAHKIYGVDSLRFCAFLMVFLSHTLPFGFAYQGVIFFFVISAFLLTHLAIFEIKETGKFSQVNFFIRRALRIYPLYFLIVIFSFTIVPVLSNHYQLPITLPADKWKFFVFLSNTDDSPFVFYLKYFWSIAVEEQFYLIFILLSFFFKRNIWLTILLLYCVYFIAIIYYYFQKENLPLSSLLNTLPCFATGMVVAKLCFYKKRGIPKFIALFLLMAILLEVAEKKFVFLTDLSNLKYALYCSIPLFLVVNFQKQLLLIIKNTSLKITEWLGKITYGLYVYSGIIITAVKMIIKPESAYTLFALSFIILLPVAWLSYKFFEQPFLKLKDRWRYGSKLSSLS